jgi:hypothetical protein
LAEFRGLLEGLTDAQIAGVKTACEQSQHYFTRFMFKAMEGHAFRVGRHHKLIDNTLDDVIAGKCPRLIVNEPPGYSKTLQCVIMFVARGFALNPRCRFLHASYSRELVNDNSAKIMDVMGCPSTGCCGAGAPQGHQRQGPVADPGRRVVQGISIRRRRDRLSCRQHGRHRRASTSSMRTSGRSASMGRFLRRADHRRSAEA